MAEEIENTKIEDSSEEEKLTLASILNGSFLTSKFFTKNIKFILFLSFLSIIYISNRNQSERILNEISNLQKEVRTTKAEAISIASELMFISKQSEVLKLVNEKNIGLKEAKEPHKKIKIEE